MQDILQKEGQQYAIKSDVGILEKLSELLGISSKTISKWEGNKSESEINILVKICDLFNVTLDYLTTGNMHMDKMDAVSKIELACREDNIALLDGINIKLYDSSGKDIYFYAEKYKAKNILNLDAKNIASVGDQVFTDVWGAKRCGIRNILVRPIDKKEEIQIVIKRKFEKIVLYFFILFGPFQLFLNIFFKINIHFKFLS